MGNRTLRIREAAVELNRQFTDQLKELGFQRVLGSIEYPGGKFGDPQVVESQRPLITGCNNGKVVVCDLFGAPWLARWKSLTSEAQEKFNNLTAGFPLGAWVPHSNSCDDRCTFCHPPNILHLNCTPFDPVAFLGGGWTIEEQDERSLTLTEVDLSKVRLEITLQKGETSVRGEEKLLRLKAMPVIRLGAKVAQALYENPSQIPEEWKEYAAIYFDGTVLRGPGGDRCVLCLYWDGGRWDWDYGWLGDAWSADEPSAVLASPPKSL